MPVFVTSRTFTDEYTGTTSGKFLNGVIGDRITVEIAFYVKWSSENIGLTFDSEEQTITRDCLESFCNIGDTGSFISDGFREGDTFDFVASGSSNEGSYTISKVYDRYIVVEETLIDETVESSSLFGTTVVTSIDYYYNLCENEVVNFFNLSDRETKPRYSVYDLFASGGGLHDMIVTTNSKAWVNGSAQITNGVVTDYKQEFFITQIFDINPQWLAAQQENFEDGIPPAPEYYADRLALKHIFQIDAKFLCDDPDIPHTGGIDSVKGNTSWYDEQNNGSDSPYSVTSIDYTDVVSSGSVSGIQRCAETDVVMVISSNVAGFLDGIFNANTQLLLGHVFCPKNESVYVNQRTNEYKDCFRYDRALLTGASSGVNGDEFGTDNQILTDINVSVDSTTQITVSFRASPSAAIQTQMAAQADDDMQYSLFLTIQYVAP